MLVKGLPDSYRAFVVHITQTGDALTFSEFKSKLRSYECTEKNREDDVNADGDNVMKFNDRAARGRGTEKKKDWSQVQCYTCRKFGHTARRCPDGARERREEQTWDTPQRDHLKKAYGEEDETGTDFFF